MVAVWRSAVAVASIFVADGMRVRVNKNRKQASGACADPASAVVGTMNCITDSDGSCANQGFSRRGYEKLHNSNKAPMPPFAADSYWSRMIQYSTFTTWINHQENIGKNQAEVRYIDNIQMSDGSNFGRSPSRTYPFSATFKQYEHAIVTVDDDCKIIRWDQYGDNKEQTDADAAMDALIAEVGVVALAEVASAGSNVKTSGSLVQEDFSGENMVESSGRCADPLASIMHTMDCIHDKDSACANAGYNWILFDKYHNGQNAGVQLFPVDIYWDMATRFSTLTLDFDFSRNNDAKNTASVRYVEKVEMSDGTDFNLAPRNEYPFNYTTYQYEHALVTVDDNCKMTRWDQYGDNAEQDIVDKATDDMMNDQGVRCDIGLALPWQC